MAKLLIEIDVDFDNKELKKVNQGLNDIEKNAKKSQSGLKRLEGGLDTLTKGFGALAGAAVAFQQAFELAEQGAQLQRLERNFATLAGTIDTTADSLLNNLRGATAGLVSDADLIASATDIINLGLGKTEDEVVRLATVISTLGLDMQQVILTFANNSVARLDALGLSIETVQTKARALEAQGLDADKAFDTAVLESLEDKMALVGGAVDDNAAAWQRARVTLQEYTNSAKELLSTGLTPWIRLLNGELQQSLMNNKRALVENGTTLEDYIKIVKSTDTIWQNSKFRVQELTDEYKELKRVIDVEVAESFDRKLVNAVNKASDATDDYALRQLFITRALEQSSQATAQWNDDVFEQQILTEKIATSTENAQNAFRIAASTTTDYAKSMENLNSQVSNYFDIASRDLPTQFDFNQLLFDAAKAAGAPLDVLADLGVELGILTKDQAQLASDFELSGRNAEILAQKLADGRLTVEEAITAQGDFRGSLKETENSYIAVKEQAGKLDEATRDAIDQVAELAIKVGGVTTAAAAFRDGGPYKADFIANVSVQGGAADLLNQFGRGFFQPADDSKTSGQTTVNNNVNVNIPTAVTPGMGKVVGSDVANYLGSNGAR